MLAVYLFPSSPFYWIFFKLLKGLTLLESLWVVWELLVYALIFKFLLSFQSNMLFKCNAFFYHRAVKVERTVLSNVCLSLEHLCPAQMWNLLKDNNFLDNQSLCHPWKSHYLVQNSFLKWINGFLKSVPLKILSLRTPLTALLSSWVNTILLCRILQLQDLHIYTNVNMLIL